MNNKDKQRTQEYFDKKRILVVAGNKNQYRDFLRETGINPNKTQYCCRWWQMMGTDKENTAIVFAGTYWDNPLFGSDELKYNEQFMECFYHPDK